MTAQGRVSTTDVSCKGCPQAQLLAPTFLLLLTLPPLLLLPVVACASSLLLLLLLLVAHP